LSLLLLFHLILVVVLLLHTSNILLVAYWCDFYDKFITFIIKIWVLLICALKKW
jgi:hypothetical protein